MEPIQFKKKELAKFLNIGQTKIDEFVKRGELRPYKIDGMVFFHRDDVMAWVDHHRFDGGGDLEVA